MTRRSRGTCWDQEPPSNSLENGNPPLWTHGFASCLKCHRAKVQHFDSLWVDCGYACQGGQRREIARRLFPWGERKSELEREKERAEVKEKERELSDDKLAGKNGEVGELGVSGRKDERRIRTPSLLSYLGHVGPINLFLSFIFIFLMGVKRLFYSSLKS